MDGMNRIEFEQDSSEFTDIEIEQFNDICDVVRVTRDFQNKIKTKQNVEKVLLENVLKNFMRLSVFIVWLSFTCYGIQPQFRILNSHIFQQSFYNVKH